MGAEAIIHLKRPGFPKETFDDTSYRTTIEYVGLVTQLLLHSPGISTAWGDYPGLVTSDDLERFENKTHGILTVVCERKFEPGDGSSATGVKLVNETTYEIDWVDVPQTLLQHPAFASGGSSELTDTDKLEIESWEKNPYIDYKKDFTFKKDGDYITPCSAADPTLSENAQLYAKGRLKGIDGFVAKLPVAIRSDTWVKGPPPAGTAGQKEEPEGFPNLPTGYEWIRGADRALRAGGQTTWSQTVDWQGVNKVLIDADDIFWT